MASVQLTGAPIGLLVVGDSIRLDAAAVKTSGVLLPNQSITWTSSVASVATISAAGRLFATDAGTTVISATSAGHTAQVTITVAFGAILGTAGGSLSAAAGRLTLTVPASALSQPTQLFVRLAPTSPADPRLCPQTYEFNNYGCARVMALVQAPPQPWPLYNFYNVRVKPARAQSGFEGAVAQPSEAGPVTLPMTRWFPSEPVESTQCRYGSWRSCWMLCGQSSLGVRCRFSLRIASFGLRGSRRRGRLP